MKPGKRNLPGFLFSEESNYFFRNDSFVSFLVPILERKTARLVLFDIKASLDRIEY